MSAPRMFSTTGSALTADEISFAQHVAASFSLNTKRGWVKLVRRVDSLTGAIVEYHGDKNIAYVTPGGGIVGYSGSKAVKWLLKGGVPSELAAYPGSTISQAISIGKGGAIVGAVVVDGISAAAMWSGKSSIELLVLPEGFSGNSTATGVSDSGSAASVELSPTAGGTLLVGRWTRELGTQYLSVLPTTTISGAYDMSGDGSTIVGYVRNPSYEEINQSYFSAVYWDVSGAMHFIYPLVLGSGIASFATAVSRDGNVIVGENITDATGFRWTPATGPISLGPSPLSTVRPVSVSDDGSVIVGSMDNQFTGESNAFRWTAETGVVDLGYLHPGDTISAAAGVSANGKIVVGVSGTSVGDRAFRWTAETGMVELLPLPGETTAVALDIS